MEAPGPPRARRTYSVTQVVRNVSLYQRVQTGRSFVFAVRDPHGEVICQREVSCGRTYVALATRAPRAERAALSTALQARAAAAAAAARCRLVGSHRMMRRARARAASGARLVGVVIVASAIAR
jgi:hypothetical protein